MNMKRRHIDRSWLISCAAVVIASLTSASVFGQDETNSPLCFVVALTDGSKVVGTPLTSSVPVETAYAALDISLTNISEMAMGAEDKKAILTLMNGDILSVSVDMDALPLKTLLGDLSIRLQHIQRVKRYPDADQTGMVVEALPPASTVRARHILVKAAQNDGDAARAESKRVAEQIRKQLIDGAGFADMAAKHSDCPSKQKGGDLGSFGRGQMVKPFEDAAFSQKENAIGPVVETQFGYHIIQVIERH
jgi:parvulin-like peptidyl-prolyl isomerase